MKPNAPSEEMSARLTPRGGGALGERQRAVVRVGIALVACAMFALSTPRETHLSRDGAWTLLAGWTTYGIVLVGCTTWVARRSRLSALVRLADALVCLLWIALTGGLDSPWVAAVYVLVASIALRYTPRLTLVVAMGASVALGVVAAICDQLPTRTLDFVVRVAWLLVLAIVAATTAAGRQRFLSSKMRLLELTQEVGSVGTWEWHIEENKLIWSGELHRIFGIPEDVEPTLDLYMAAVHPDDRAELQRSIDTTMRENAPLRADHRILRRDGTVRWVHCRGRMLVDAHGRPTELVGSSQDVTDRHLLQQQVRNSDKLASIGTMASGIAHEINNPLSYLSNNVEIVERRLDARGASDAVTSDALAAVKDAAIRVRDIVRGLKTLSRSEADDLQPVDVARTADLAVAIAAHEIGRCARLVRSYSDVPPVLANESRLSQVFVNLLVNAAQSFEGGESPQNEIRIEIAPDRNAVRIAVVDTGVGIEPAVRRRIFDPFFTTKPTGVGTGLGLSICHGIVRELGGAIRVDSTPGKGSRFEITLPACASKMDPPAIHSGSPPRLPRSHGQRRARVLVVDDEPRYARSLALLLGEDHDVVLAPNGRAALETVRDHSPFHLVLCDLMMPEMTGMDVYEALSQDDRRKVVFLTGGPTTDAARAFLAQPSIRHLEKPIEAGVLESLVEAASRGCREPNAAE